MSDATVTLSRQKEIFLAARDLDSALERQKYLDSACGDDASLRARIDSMLAADASEAPLLNPDALAGHEAATLAAGDKIGYFGDYVLLDEIARGASGVVFRARQVSLDRVVALKMLRDRPLLTSEADIQRLRAEAAAAASLDHPNIVPIHEVGVHEGQPYFSMKLIEGGTLQFRMAEYHQDIRKAVALIAKVSRAVHAAHAAGILHRDLKPGNILLDAAGEPHITDFGLARRMGADSGLTLSGQIMGTPHYMAPEQARGETRQLTPGADIYSLGAMLYELLAGRHVFAGENDLIALLKRVAEAMPPALPPSVPRPLAAIVMKCLEKQPSARYGTAEDLAEDLERWLRGQRVQAHPAGWCRRTFRRPATVLAASAAILVAAFGVKKWWDYQRSIVIVTTLADELDARAADGTGVSLREALRDAPEHARIRFAAPGKLVLSAQLGGLDLRHSLEIDGGGLEIHSVPEVERIFRIGPDAVVRLKNLTLSGEANTVFRRGNVGAIDCAGTLEAIDCRFIGNGGGGNGGAISCSGHLQLLRCVFRDNTCQSVGAALIVQGRMSQVRIEDCLFTGNRAYGNGGGAICVSNNARHARVELTRCTLTANACTKSPNRPFEADYSGAVAGGIRIQAGHVVLDRCIIAGNQAPVAGKEDIDGSYEQAGPNHLSGAAKDAPAGLGSSLRE